VQHQASDSFLFEHLDKLQQLPKGKHFNRKCIRVIPTRLTAADRPTWVDTAK
jgi:hypothetical protein